jgi:hypothetical protein
MYTYITEYSYFMLTEYEEQYQILRGGAVGGPPPPPPLHGFAPAMCVISTGFLLLLPDNCGLLKSYKLRNFYYSLQDSCIFEFN